MADDVGPDPLDVDTSPQWSKSSFYMKERKRFDTPKRLGGEKCDGYEAYPRMLYKAQENPLSGKYEVGATRDVLSKDRTRILFDAEAFSRSCQMTVKTENEYSRARDEGWRDSPKEALEFHERLQTEIMRAAAERNYSDRNMSDGAKAEAKRFEESVPEQVPEIPESRKRRKDATAGA